MPEDFAQKLAEYLDARSRDELEELHRDVSTAIGGGEDTVQREEIEIPARAETLNTIAARLERIAEREDDDGGRADCA